MKLKYHLHRGQGEVFKSKARFKVLAAGRRWGKTIYALVTLITNALSKDDSLNWYVAPSYRQAKMIAWRQLKKMIPEGDLKGKPNESELSIELRNGSVIELKGSENEDALRGVGVNLLIIDEFASIYDNWSVWHEVLRPTLLKTTKAGAAGDCIFIGTPKGKDAFYELYLKGQQGGEKDWASWQFKTIDSPYISAEEIESARASSPDRYYKQEYEASFEGYTGLIYPEFSEDKHIIPVREISDNWELIGGIDPALTGTTAVLFAGVDINGDIYFYDEYYEQDKRVSEVVAAIKEKDNVPNRWIIDPASKIRNVPKEGKMFSIFDEYSEYGIMPVMGENDVMAGINRVGEYLKTGKIKIFKHRCPNLVKEIERYHWTETKETVKGEVKSEPFKKFDHGVDIMRYICMSRAKGHTQPQKKAPRHSVAWFIEQDSVSENDWRRAWKS